MILLEDLGESVRKGLENEGIIQRPVGKFIDIIEYQKNKKQKTALSQVRIQNIPSKNIWIFQSEIDDIQCLRNENATVEKIILYLNGDKLFAFLVEMKRDMNKSALRQLRDKFTCSLVRLSIFISGNQTFTQLKGVQLFPVGVTCFNENTFYWNHDVYHIKKSPFRERFLELEFSIDVPKQVTTINIQPITLPNMTIPVLFFQNPSYLDETIPNKNNFEFNFQELVEY